MEHSAAFTAALILAGINVFGGWNSRREPMLEFWENPNWISAAAGISVAYVFIDLLPELGAQQRVFAESRTTASMLFSGSRIYVLALISFVLFFGLDRIVLPNREGNGKSTGYRVRLAGFAAYSVMIGYLLVEREERGPLALTIYAFVMVVHFLIVGHSLAEMRGLDRQMPSRLVLSGSLLIGCLISATYPLSETIFARLFALLAGGVVITSLTYELPGQKGGKFLPFCLGAAIFAAVLLVSEAVK